MNFKETSFYFNSFFFVSRLLEYVFSGDFFMLASDPFGRNGSKLDEYLSFSAKKQNNKHPKFQLNNHQIVNALDLTYTIQNHSPSTKKNSITNLYDLKSNGGRRYENYVNAAKANLNNAEFSKIRNVAQTTELFNQLLLIFPNNENEIKNIINDFPKAIDIQYLINKLLERI